MDADDDRINLRKKENSNNPAGDHFGNGDSSRDRNITEPGREAALELDGGSVSAAIEGFEDGFFYNQSSLPDGFLPAQE